jgi:IS30 family transposase
MGREGYKHLNGRDRLLISQLRDKGLSQSAIARAIGRDRSTVSRELRRNAYVSTPWDRRFYECISKFWTEEDLDAHLATQPPSERRRYKVWSHRDAQAIAEGRAWRASMKRRRKKPETRRWVVRSLRRGWSPEQIAGRSRHEAVESVSHEYVYALVYRDKKRGGDLHRCLRRFGRRKQRFGARSYEASRVATKRRSIEVRPAVVDARSRLGDCEADLIVGHRQSGYILSVVDRRSRATVLRRLANKRMETVREQLELARSSLGGARTLTVDNGTEFFGHRQLEAKTGTRVYFTHPYCSTERGSIENLNGLIRQYFPKRSSFSRVTQQRLDVVQDLLNTRPRRCLGFLTPLEAHARRADLRTPSRVALGS